MKTTILSTSSPHHRKRVPLALALAVAVTLLHQNATATPTVNLGTASSFAILAGAGITVAGAVNSTTIDGNIGSFGSSTAITGLGSVVLTGVNHAGDGVTQGAKSDLTTAFTTASGLPATSIAGGDNQLGGKTLVSGVYSFGAATTANLIGNLTLDAQGNANSIWVFIASSTLITASSSSVNLINGADGCKIFWVVDSSATLGSSSLFNGNIMALTSIGLGTGAQIADGSALAENGAVTLDGNNTINNGCNATTGGGGGTRVPETGNTLLLLGFGMASLLGLKLHSRTLTHPLAFVRS